ncbi:glycosyltransferase family 2 protein [Patescibacteria group bacterium]|nr:glycosyltransferase family 2 protein [Patescibacteria group bacterium]
MVAVGKRQTITALIPAFNEEKHIGRCLKSVAWCDRVVVVWMGHDQTGALAKQAGAEVIVRHPIRQPDFTLVQQNVNWAIDHAATDWILRIDADETVNDALKNEILIILNSQPVTRNQIVAFGIPRNQFFCGAFLRGGDWYYDRLVRLFRPKFARYDPVVAVHEQFKVKGNVGYLTNRLNHYSHPTLKDAVAKFRLYARIEAAAMSAPVYLALAKMVVMPFYVFGRWFFWHRGYRDGWRGLLAGALRGWYEGLIYFDYLTRGQRKA